LGETDLTGKISLEKDFEEILSYYRGSGRWSGIEEVPWEQMKAMR
jgi:hypothetical protein